MSIGRVLFGLATGVAGWLLAKQVRKLQNDLQEQANKQAPSSRTAQPRSTGNSAPQTMIACAHCGLHIPEKEATRHDGRFFCSSEHAALGAAQ